MGLRATGLVLVSALTLSVGGCGADEDAPPPPGSPDRASVAGLTRQGSLSGPRSPSSRWGRAPEPEPVELSRLAAPPDIVIEQPSEASPSTPSTGAQVPPRRDLGDELRRAIGGIEGCLDAQTAARLGGSLSVSISATALPSGRLQRASVSAGSLPSTAVECIRARAEAASLAPPIEGAPRTVSTTLRFQVSASLTSETRRELAPDVVALPPGSQAPGLTLPALGQPGPAPGARAPGIVLPAVVGEGPPPGYVAPGLTLPAQGPVLAP
ncbi:MAG: hypothetical protein OHK0013_41710 [Sandaracinaceae bacterium]